MFGFTGTPIFAENSRTIKGISMTTEQMFGERLHTYTIVNAIADKNVKISAGKEMKGTDTYPMYIAKNHTV